MYQVVVIDDESWALLGIRNVFEWASYDFEIAAEFTDPEEAFEFICRVRPDVVFTDIRMPKFNGIDIMRMTRERGIDTEFVIVSGYAEFSYVQEALSYGALDYCLKPINPETTGRLLDKVRNRVKSKQSAKDYTFIETLAGKSGKELHRLNPDFFCLKPCYWYAVIAYTYEIDGSLKLKGLNYLPHLEIDINSSKKLYIVKGPCSNPAETQTLNLTLEPGLKSIGISGRYGTLESIFRLIKEADIAALQGFVSGQNEISEYKDDARTIQPILAKLQHQLESDAFTHMDELLSFIGNEFVEKKLGMNEAVYFWNQTIGIIMNHYKDEEKIEGLEYLNYLELRDRFKDFDSMIGFITAVFHQLTQKNNLPVKSNEMIRCFDQLIKYIDQHYNQELYIKDLSDRFYLNQFTCCKLFKKELGKTFTEYVMDIRLREACRLMKNTDMTIEEIAFKVGYSDYFYFNKVFKKHYGITPARYKRNQTEEE